MNYQQALDLAKQTGSLFVLIHNINGRYTVANACPFGYRIITIL